MVKVGRKLYYDISSGNAIVETGERMGAVRETTRQEDFQIYKSLAEREPHTVGVVVLEYGDYSQDFTEGVWVGIDLEKSVPIFQYSDPADPEAPPVYQPPLSEQINVLKQENTLLKAQNAALSERADFIEDVIAEMANQVYQ
ncbi:hypothetical protein JJQ72_06325 [Paenibacillus sp. F411]|uniref:hypothetical protein n=1 Tax=Paenibacillus sp. F411 TaxID=2820239 RepID=UPI001AAF55F1|nr:hypothetical protein [Paenibacillus sp. F411]MBO2943593.1 hypothetical protein [Paenibacillus sp. F411]